MYLRVRSVCALRMVSIDSVTSQAREVWMRPHFTIRGIRFFSDLGSAIIALITGGGGAGAGISTSATSMTVVGDAAGAGLGAVGAGISTPATSMTAGGSVRA